MKATSIPSPSPCHVVLATKGFVTSYEIRHSVSYEESFVEHKFRENRLSDVVKTTTLANREEKEGGQNWFNIAPNYGLLYLRCQYLYYTIINVALITLQSTEGKAIVS